MFETFTFDQGLTGSEPPTPRSSPRNPFLNLSSLTERRGKKRDRLSVGKQSFVWPPKESVFGSKELKMAGLLNMLVYQREKQETIKKQKKKNKKTCSHILQCGRHLSGCLRMSSFPQKATAALTTADCKHTAHYPGIEPTLQI